MDHRDRPSAKRMLWGTPKNFYSELDPLLDYNSMANQFFVNFRENIDSAFRIGSLPFSMTASAVRRQRISQLYSAERIRSLIDVPSSADLTEEHEHAALERARRKLAEEENDAESLKTRAGTILNLLDGHLEDEDFSKAQIELQLQILVIAWSSYEALANDIFRCFLNNYEKLAIQAINSKFFGEQISSRGFFTGAIENFGLDMSGKFGDILFDKVPLDNLSKIVKAHGVIFGDFPLKNSEAFRQLMLLEQQRHLIAHKRGYVDYKYLERSGDEQEIGARLMPNAQDITKKLAIALKFGVLLIEKAIDTEKYMNK